MHPFTRRQRIILDLICSAHKLEMHPSAAKLSSVLERTGYGPCGVNAVRSEIGRLILAKAITDVVAGSGSSAAKFKIADCNCHFCNPPKITA